MDEIIEIAKPYLKHIRKCVTNPERYRISRNIKGSHTADTIKCFVNQKKITQALDYALQKGATNMVHARISKSVYVTLNGTHYRLSDHGNKSFEGTSILIRWNANMEDVLKSII